MARIADPSLRKTILSAARQIFQRKGYNDARMADIAEAANVAVGTIYLHFKTKEALVVALAAELNQRILHEALPKLMVGDLRSAIAESTRTTLAICRQESDLIRMLYLQIGFAAFVETSPADQQVWEALTVTLQDRMDRGEAHLYDPGLLAQLLSGLVDRAAMLSALQIVPDEQALEEMLVRFVQNALVKRND